MGYTLLPIDKLEAFPTFKEPRHNYRKPLATKMYCTSQTFEFFKIVRALLRSPGRSTDDFAGRGTVDGDARMFRLGVEARRLRLAYEYDPFFSLPIARVDPSG